MEKVKYEVWKAARDGRTTLLLRFVKKNIRQNIVDEVLNHHTDVNGQNTTPLIIAAINGHDEVVDVLCRFGAQIDEKGTVMFYNCYHSGVTALGCASHMGHEVIVKQLIENGANINLLIDFGSTCLIRACKRYGGNFGFIRYLVEHGADVNTSNNNNVTCLMVASAMGNYHIVQYLLEEGADPESVSNDGQTALHGSAAGGHFEITKLLIETGLEMTKDNDGMTPLMMAAINQKCSIVEYLSSLPECNREDKIDALELLGTSYIFGGDSRLSRAYHFFETAMQERYTHPNDVIKKRFVAMSSIIIGTAECQTLGDLEEIEENPLSMCIEALAILERILGAEDPRICKPILETGEMLADNGIYDKCLDLWLFALRCHRCSDQKFDFGRFPELFADMIRNGRSLKFSPLLEVFKETVIELIQDKRQTQTDNENIEFKENYDKDIFVCLYLIGMMLLTKTTSKEKDQLRREVYNFLHQKPRLLSGATPLHMCCDSATNDNTIDVKNIILFPNTLICRMLLTCGADVNAQDEAKQTPLHVISKKGNSIVHIRKISKCLIEHGAHVDACTIYGEQAIDVATMDIIKMHMDLRLDCLAARVVMRHRLKYQNVIPASLIQFVELH